MVRIYTRGGDKGKTSIHGGARVPKDDIRIEANGTLDELNAELGIVRSLIPSSHEYQPILKRIQQELMGVMSHVATPSVLREKNPNPLPEGLVDYCERQIDQFVALMDDNSYFVLPGGTPAAAHLQLARTIARRAERRLWTLNREDELPTCILQFINRLSDLLFVLARYEMFRDGNPEERWKEFLYKRKRP